MITKRYLLMKFVMEKEENVVKKVEDDEEEILGFGDWEI